MPSLTRQQINEMVSSGQDGELFNRLVEEFETTRAEKLPYLSDANLAHMIIRKWYISGAKDKDRMKEALKEYLT